MVSPSNHPRHSVKPLWILVIVAAVLAACGGGPTPTAPVVMVTATFTPEPEVTVVTATFTPTAEVVPSDTPQPSPTTTPSPPPSPTSPPPTEPPPSPTPEPTPAEFSNYEHPSGAFRVGLPSDMEPIEDELSVIVADDSLFFMVSFVALDEPLSAAELEENLAIMMDLALVDAGLITSYDDVQTETSSTLDLVAASFAVDSELYGEGDGRLVMWQLEQTLYVLALVAPEYAAVEPIWEQALDSFSATPIEPTATPPAPTATATRVPPSPTPKPKPTAKPTAAPPPPPPPASKGCYLIQNHLGADLTLTFTAKDWQWSDSFSMAANGEKEYCLDPGRYSYTLDAPPPWGSTNGDLQVNAGDRFLWPIRGQE